MVDHLNVCAGSICLVWSYSALQTWIAFKRDPKLYTDEYEITIDNSGVYAKNSTTEARRLWSAYNMAFESDQVFLLVYGKRAYSAIPKRAFSDENQINIFRELLKEKIGKLENIGKSTV